MYLTRRKWLSFGISFLIGAAALCCFSFFHKMSVGFNPFIFKSYIAPFLFGGCLGANIGMALLRIHLLKEKLEERVYELENLLPICAKCKKIKLEKESAHEGESWIQVESYLTRRMHSECTHSFCPDCLKRLYGFDVNAAQGDLSLLTAAKGHRRKQDSGRPEK